MNGHKRKDYFLTHGISGSMCGIVYYYSWLIMQYNDISQIGVKGMRS